MPLYVSCAYPQLKYFWFCYSQKKRYKGDVGDVGMLNNNNLIELSIEFGTDYNVCWVDLIKRFTEFAWTIRIKVAELDCEQGL